MSARSTSLMARQLGVPRKCFFHNLRLTALIYGRIRYNYEYSTREAYGGNISWPVSAPLSQARLRLIARSPHAHSICLYQQMQLGGTRLLSVISLAMTTSPQSTDLREPPSEMEIQPSLVSQFTEYQGRLSVKTTNVTTPTFTFFRTQLTPFLARPPVYLRRLPGGQDLLHAFWKCGSWTGLHEWLLQCSVRCLRSRDVFRIPQTQRCNVQLVVPKLSRPPSRSAKASSWVSCRLALIKNGL